MTMSFSTAVIAWFIHQAINHRCNPLDTERARIGNEVFHVVTASPVFGNQSEGFKGAVAETVAINQSLTINDLDVMGNWYYRPDYMAIMSNCANTQIGVWSEDSFDRSVLVAVYGQPA